MMHAIRALLCAAGTLLLAVAPVAAQARRPEPVVRMPGDNDNSGRGPISSDVEAARITIAPSGACRALSIQDAANGAMVPLGCLDTSDRAFKMPGFLYMTIPDGTVSGIVGTGAFAVATDRGDNAIVGAGVTRVPNTFPTAVTGQWVMPLSGGTGFALVGMCDLRANGSCNSEIDARNYAGAPPATPGNWSFGTTDNISVGLHLGAGGAYNPGIGLSVGADGAAPRRFETGIYMWAQGHGPRVHGLFIDADATTGPQISALIRSTGAAGSTHLQLQTMGTASPTRPVIQHLNASGTPTWGVDQAGDATFNGTIAGAAYLAGGVVGVSCSGPPTASFTVTSGIVTHC